MFVPNDFPCLACNLREASKKGTIGEKGLGKDCHGFSI